MLHHLSYIGLGIGVIVVCVFVPVIFSYGLDNLCWWLAKKTGRTPNLKKDFFHYWVVSAIGAVGIGLIYGLGKLVSWLLFR